MVTFARGSSMSARNCRYAVVWQLGGEPMKSGGRIGGNWKVRSAISHDAGDAVINNIEYLISHV